MNIYNYKEVKEKFKNQYNINIQIARKKIFKIAKGLYSDKEDVDELLVLFKKYPGCILTLESAFYYYDLSKIKPNKIKIGTRRNFTRINMFNVQQIFYSNTRLDENAIHYVKDKIEVNVFSRERLLVELIRNKKKFDKKYYEEVYNNFLRISDSLDAELVLNYAKMYKNKEAERYAKMYIHDIDYNQFDVEDLLTDDKNTAYAYGKLHYFDFSKECECCHNITLNLFQEVCYVCGWWSSYSDTYNEDELNKKNNLSLSAYRNKYLKLIKENSDYIWSEFRNRTKPIRKIVRKNIIDQEKKTCACCGNNSIKSWYEQCEICGWIADYVQEANNGDNDSNGANEYPLWLYMEEYNLYLKNNPNYIYKNSPKRFLNFLQREVDDIDDLEDDDYYFEDDIDK